MNAVELAIFSNKINGICEEMGAVLCKAAFSPNIKDRLDYSCAIFDSAGKMVAQAAHIPVHLGSMAYAMTDLIDQHSWQPGDMLVVNDPYLGGTHLPDVTLIAPIMVDEQLLGLVANRAHHVDIGANSPGSMPISSSLDEEGIVIPPTLLVANGNIDEALLGRLSGGRSVSRGDFQAQISANIAGVKRVLSLLESIGCDMFVSSVQHLHDYGYRLAQAELAKIPNGHYVFSDVMDDDGQGNETIALRVSITVTDEKIRADFTGTSQQVAGNINCPLSVAAAAVYYCFRCLLPAYTPTCQGVFDAIEIFAPEGSLVNAKRPGAVAAGNVETSMRLVDVVLGALAQAIPELIPAASQGTMNNIAMGAATEQINWNYYETIAGGTGAGKACAGQHCVQSHMTNTLNTPIESLESHFPVRISRYQRRQGSGGAGKNPGGDGLIREFEFLDDAQVTLLTERRSHQPWGLNGAESGLSGLNYLNDQTLPGKQALWVKAGDRIRIETPGGGGWGTPATSGTSFEDP